MTDVTLPDNDPTRKQQFHAALDLAGLTLRQWCESVYRTDPAYVYRILTGREPGGAEINAAIDATIEKYVGFLTVPRGTDEAVEGTAQAVKDAAENRGDVFGGHAA